MVDIVAVSITTVGVELFAGIDLDLVELLNDVFNELSCTLLEDWNSISFAALFEVLLDLWEETLDVSHEFTFAEGDLLETESINNIDNADCV